ncbi:MAG: flagellar basal body P-ring formation chaperone FlgA [Gemmatales bacterium]|nr:flagellar basal body P-ring formation chaperone FlgA [Gemmatales bacterium]MDW8175996.1 flagellar basal body P-ring formation chaperone FlgA [Gemmatales bacterium]
MESETLISRRRIIYRLQLAGWDPGTVQVTGAEAVRVRWCGNAQAVEIPASYAATPAKPLSLASPGKPDQTSKSTCTGSNIEDARSLVNGGSDISGTGQPRNSYPGNIMRPASEGSGIVVKKGEWVRLIARVGPLEISTRGEALADGKLGQVIPVRNTESKQTIQARIIRPATCQVDY